MSAATLVLDSITLCTPVLLPVGQRTMPNIFAASVGVSVPYLLFLVFMFNYLHGVWMQNHEGDKLSAQSKSEAALLYPSFKGRRATELELGSRRAVELELGSRRAAEFALSRASEEYYPGPRTV